MSVLDNYRLPGHTHGADELLDFLLAEAAVAAAVAAGDAVTAIERTGFYALLLKSKRIIGKHCNACSTFKVNEDFIASAKHDKCRDCHASYERTRTASLPTYKPATTGDKHCKRCDQTKPVTGFGRNKRNKDGLHNYCKPCAYAQVRASNENKK